jgi:hypothetical protein
MWLINDSGGYYILYNTAGPKAVVERYDIAPGYFAKKLISPESVFPPFDKLQPHHYRGVIKLLWRKTA